MVFVPEGPFIMGSNKHFKAEIPEHTVTLEAYWIDKTEFTNAMFSAFVANTGYQTTAEKQGKSFSYNKDTKALALTTGANWQHPQGKESSLEGIENHPVVQMTWDDARAYCEWAGGRLPTEEDWEKAARGEDGRIFPWGNDPLDGTRANTADKNFPEGIKSIDDGYKFTAPVGTYPLGASPYGALDMNGNVSEWVDDLFHVYPRRR